MIVNELQINATLIEILQELQEQLAINRIPLLRGKIVDSGNNVQVCCIYHKNGQEHRPSAGIHKDTGIYHCLACGETKTLSEFISDCFGHYNDAGTYGIHWLVRNFVTIAVDDRPKLKIDLSRKIQCAENSVVVSEIISDSVLDEYRYYHPYMYKRRLTDAIIEKFDIGYDKQTRCITFPIRDVSGNTLFVARRSVDTKYFNYPAGSEKPLYGVYELSKLVEYPKSIVVCESMLDALTVWVYGDYAVALNGLGSSTQYKELRNLPCRELILATDNDDAGREARKKLKENVTNKLISEFIIPKGKKDINELEYNEYKSMRKVY